MTENWREHGQHRSFPRKGAGLVVGIGEALFDCFVDSEKQQQLSPGDGDAQDASMKLGGAPLNFAVHANAMLREVGGQAILASRVGHDKLGERICQEIEARGMSAEGIQRDPETATGLVKVRLANAASTPLFEISAHTAWDRFAFDDHWRVFAESCSAVCFGTLAQRSSTSHAAILSFLTTAKQALRICDLNFRQDFFSEAVVRKSLELASVVQANEDELEIAAALMCIKQSDDLRETAKRLRDAFDLSHVAVTRGARGAILVTQDEMLEGLVCLPNAINDADSVGAGDAFCAGLTVGLLLGWSNDEALQLANRGGADVASKAGGTPALSTELLEWLRRTHAAYVSAQAKPSAS